MLNQRNPNINSKISLFLIYTIKKHIEVKNDNPNKMGFFILRFLINVNTSFKNINIYKEVNYKDNCIYKNTDES